MQNVLRVTRQKGKHLLLQLGRGIYPPLCLSCGKETDSTGLCGACWEKTNFISGHVCDLCGTPLMGNSDNVPCDSCLRHSPPWKRGRAVAVYGGGARRIALALKHGDRLDMGPILARWMDNVGEVVFDDIDIIAPVPVHWSRLLRRRYNQAAELSKHIAQLRLVDHIPDLLTRSKRTSMQVDMSREERIANQRSALTLTPRFSEAIKGKRVLLIDDVMTTGATMSACAEACLKAGSGDVNALVFARVAQDY